MIGGTLRLAVRAYLVLLRAAGSIPQRRRSDEERRSDVLLTLNYHAAGWPKALLTPLVMAPRCARLRLVTTVAAPGLEGAEVVHPPRWLRAICGSTVARLLTFAAIAIRTRPDVVGGVHLLFNGLTAALVARLAGARSLYICVGGPNELAGGGIHSENRVFSLRRRCDPALERLLLEAVGAFDTVVTMGTGAADYFRRQGVRDCHVIPSGVPGRMYYPDGARDIDVIVVARLVPLKRIDLFVRAIQEVAQVRPAVKAVVIGKGPELEASRALALDLGVSGNVTFLGHEPDVAIWFRRAKIFLLTSDTEGVSISLIEAMLSGAVPVVSNVGDLADAVEHNVNGMLVDDRSGLGFAAPVVTLLGDDERRQRFSAAARTAASRFDPTILAGRWDVALTAAELSVHPSEAANHA